MARESRTCVGVLTVITGTPVLCRISHGKKLVNYKGTTLSLLGGVGEAIICIPKVQGNGEESQWSGHSLAWDKEV